MSTLPAVIKKKTIIGAKVTKEEKERIAGRCNGLKCNTSDYIKKLIDKDLSKAKKGGTFIRITDDKLLVPCSSCGTPISFNLAELGLRRVII